MFLIFMGIFSAFYQAGSMSSVDPEDAKRLMEQLEDIIGDIDAVGIFLHNTGLALPMFIPGFGAAWGMFSAWSTGYAFAAIVSLSPALAGVPPLALLYLSPFGLMELAAYSLGTSRSFILAAAIARKKPLRPHARATLIEAGAVVGLLLAGGFIEFYMIEAIEMGEMGLPGF